MRTNRFISEHEANLMNDLLTLNMTYIVQICFILLDQVDFEKPNFVTDLIWFWHKKMLKFKNKYKPYIIKFETKLQSRLKSDLLIKGIVTL